MPTKIFNINGHAPSHHIYLFYQLKCLNVSLSSITYPVIGAFGRFRSTMSFFRFLPFGQPPRRFLTKKLNFKQKSNIEVCVYLSCMKLSYSNNLVTMTVLSFEDIINPFPPRPAKTAAFCFTLSNARWFYLIRETGWERVNKHYLTQYWSCQVNFLTENPINIAISFCQSPTDCTVFAQRGLCTNIYIWTIDITLKTPS